MPDPARSRRAPTANKAEQVEEADNKLTGPRWARAVHHFYDPIFDIRSRASFQASLDDFVGLPDAERAFHDTHLLFRVVQGLEGVYGVLRRIEGKLDSLASPDLAALEHLAPIRAALEEIASGQPDLIEAAGFDGDEEDEEEDEEEDDDDLGDEDEAPEGEDPDFIFDTVPDDEPDQPRRPRHSPKPAASARDEAPPSAHPAPQRAPRAADPDREALVGELVPASEGPQGPGDGDQ